MIVIVNAFLIHNFPNFEVRGSKISQGAGECACCSQRWQEWIVIAVCVVVVDLLFLEETTQSIRIYTIVANNSSRVVPSRPRELFSRSSGPRRRKQGDAVSRGAHERNELKIAFMPQYQCYCQLLTLDYLSIWANIQIWCLGARSFIESSCMQGKLKCLYLHDHDGSNIYIYYWKIFLRIHL